MKTETKIDFTIDMNDLFILWGHYRVAYEGYSFSEFVKEIKDVYADFIKFKENPKTFSKWVNDQIIYLTTGNI